MTFFCGSTKILLLFILGIISSSANGFTKNWSARIVGGDPAVEQQFKYVVAVVIFYPHMHTGQAICGGAIVSERHILTAGHCIIPGFVYYAFSGTIDYSNPKANALAVKRAITHPRYVPSTNTTSMQNDLAILILKDPIILGGKMEKVFLPLAPVGPKDTAIFAGWGYLNKNGSGTSILQTLTMYFTFAYVDVCNNSNKLCAYSPHGNTCSGDSGSPLVISGRYVVGVASASDCTPGIPSIFVDVYQYRNWINYVMFYH